MLENRRHVRNRRDVLQLGDIRPYHGSTLTAFSWLRKARTPTKRIRQPCRRTGCRRSSMDVRAIDAGGVATDLHFFEKGKRRLRDLNAADIVEAPHVP